MPAKMAEEPQCSKATKQLYNAFETVNFMLETDKVLSEVKRKSLKGKLKVK